MKEFLSYTLRFLTFPRQSAPVAASFLRFGVASLQPGAGMNIDWRHDIDRVLADAKDTRKYVLLDFSAAPM